MDEKSTVTSLQQENQVTESTSLERIIVVVGHIGSGKSTVTKYLHDKYRFKVVSASSVFRTLLGQYSNTREEFQNEVMKWLEHNGEREFGLAIISHCIGSKTVIDGLRLLGALEVLKENFGGKLTIIGLKLSNKLAYKRQINRTNNTLPILDYNEFVKAREHSSENQIDELLKLSQFILSNTGNIDDLYTQVDDVLAKLG